MVFSDKVKELRTSKNLTQEQLAKRLGITRAAISAYESGIRTPSYDLLSKIANIFNITIDSLLGDTKSDVIDVLGINKDQRAIIEELIRYFKAFNEIAENGAEKILKKYNLEGLEG